VTRERAITRIPNGRRLRRGVIRAASGDNPNGTFTNWNPNVSCDAFNPPMQTQR